MHRVFLARGVLHTQLFTTGGPPHTPGTFCLAIGASPHTPGIVDCNSEEETPQKNIGTRKLKKITKKFHFPLSCPTNNATKEERRRRCNWNCRRAHFLHCNNSTKKHHKYRRICAACVPATASHCTCTEIAQIWANSGNSGFWRQCCSQKSNHAAQFITVKR